jgi:hypothetical protein
LALKQLAAPEASQEQKPRNRKGTRPDPATCLLCSRHASPMQGHHLLVVAQLPLMVFYSYYYMAIYLFFFTFLVWYKYSTQEIIRKDFFILFRKRKEKTWNRMCAG